MQTIYLETSIICHLTDPPSSNPITRACQQLTQLWWNTRCDPASVFISKYVIREIVNSDPLRVLQRMRVVDHLAYCPANENIESIAELLICGGALKANARTASQHVACAAYSGCEILLTWNCMDIANAQQFRLLRMLMNAEEHELPELVTPFQIMEDSYEALWRGNST